MSDAFVRPPTTPSRSSLVTEAALARSADFMEALVAARAMMAHADGEMATAERRRIMALVRENPLLSIVPARISAPKSTRTRPITGSTRSSRIVWPPKS